MPVKTATLTVETLAYVRILHMYVDHLLFLTVHVYIHEYMYMRIHEYMYMHTRIHE